MDTKETMQKAPKAWMGAALAMAMVLCFAASTNAQAFDKKDFSKDKNHHHHHDNHVGIGLGFGGGSTYVPGHYEAQSQTVMVEAAHYEDRWVPATYKTLLLKDGMEVTVKVADGYWTKVYVPARYETQVVQVWVPGYYVESSRPAVRVGLGFRF
ncbi:MAG: hypothetical protein KIS92_10475 [Planctomycetota bacterium]|nr:hypothetical protein [Planctomycetota bacterium]